MPTWAQWGSDDWITGENDGSTRVECALALVSTPGVSAGGEHAEQQRQRQKYRGCDEQNGERGDEHSASVVKPSVKREPFARGTCNPDDGHFHFGGASTL